MDSSNYCAGFSVDFFPGFSVDFVPGFSVDSVPGFSVDSVPGFPVDSVPAGGSSLEASSETSAYHARNFFHTAIVVDVPAFSGKPPALLTRRHEHPHTTKTS
ncbi:uncharacterized protein C8R40DRAFT_238532 [Lentinula edodes]|uniref:uncharacterized protein n=1 Tax=Lentinula edodes TaxID=5353 RepID=UPI001E8E91E9|nr:uncharacterized protein C8R40DRAFT_238532 [Lentinula edodes]KAH7874972.1 hypothetical protein C8R40DRAFT_238532 [Lentinula edodes]